MTLVTWTRLKNERHSCQLHGEIGVRAGICEVAEREPNRLQRERFTVTDPADSGSRIGWSTTIGRNDVKEGFFRF